MLQIAERRMPLPIEVANTMDSGPPGPPRGQPPGALSALTRLGRFILLERLGQGGMGQVYSAYDPDLDRKVAIKLLRDLANDSSLAVARVKLEAQAMAKVSHPNVVHVYESGEHDGRVYIVMEIVDGTSLVDWQEQRELTAPEEVARRLRVYLQAAAGLLAAHRCGLIHRDFKPDNVLLGKDGRVRVADFGLARVVAGLGGVASSAVVLVGDVDEAESGPRLTQVGTILGTPGYMSPEQVRGAEADERSDQFSFCAALYESLYGHRPFPGERFDAYAQSVLCGRLRPPPQSDVPLVVQQAILRGLALDPAARYPSMAELIVALESGLAPESEPLITRTDRIRLAFGLVAALSLIEVTNGAVVLLSGSTNSMLRGVGIITVFACINFALMRWPPWPIRHRGRYLRMMGFFSIILLTFACGRLTGLLMGMSATDYYTLENIVLAGLMAVEGLRIGWRQYLLAVPSLVYVPILNLFPHLRVVMYNLLLFGLVIASIYLHMRQPAPPVNSVNQPGD